MVFPFSVTPRRQTRACNHRHLSGHEPAAARGKALEARGHVEAGNDPRLVLAGQATAGMTVAGLVDVYLADPEKAALRSKAEIERRLRRNVIPIIGTINLSDLHRRDVRNITDPMLRRGVKGRGQPRLSGRARHDPLGCAE